jgi:hypothetical protein
MATKKRRERRQREAAAAKPLAQRLWSWVKKAYREVFGGE